MLIKMKNGNNWEVVAGASIVTVDASLTNEGAAADAKAVGDRLNAIADNNIDVDTNLTVEGAAADAKVVGDRLSALSDSIDNKLNLSGGILEGDLRLKNSNLAYLDDDGNTIGTLVINANGSAAISAGNVNYQLLTSSNFNNYAALASHTHTALDIVSGVLPIARGGTGLSESPTLQVNLESNAPASIFSVSSNPGVTGILSLTNGGTGAPTAEIARSNLGIGNVGVLTYEEVSF